LFSLTTEALVVVEIIDIACVAIGEPKGYPPIRPDGDCPKASHFALERMQPKSGQIHISHGSRSVQTKKNVAEPIRMLAHDAAMIVLFVKAFQALVADRPDHVRA